MGVIYGCYIWVLYMGVIYGCYIWVLYMGVIYGCAYKSIITCL